MSTSGYRFSPVKRFFSTYEATVHICEMGTAIVVSSLKG
jgi:hypothetical protein